MPEPYTANDLLNAIAVASKTLSERKDEINRLNVFPVPDGDTGTNMSLTLETVVENLRSRHTKTPVSLPRKFCAACARAA